MIRENLGTKKKPIVKPGCPDRLMRHDIGCKACKVSSPDWNEASYCAVNYSLQLWVHSQKYPKGKKTGTVIMHFKIFRGVCLAFTRPDLGRGKRARDGGALPHRASPPSTVLSTVTGRRYVKVALAQLLLSTKPPSGLASANREMVVVTAQGVPIHDIQVM